MPLYLNEEQLMLQDSARGFFDEKAPVSHMRELRDSNDALGFSRSLWRDAADMGFSSILIPEDKGGLGLGYIEAGIVLEQIGRNLTPSPFLETAVGGVAALGHTLDGAQDWLGSIARGEVVVALALDEAAKHAPEALATTMTRSESGYRLTGVKRFVPHAHVADLWIVSARLSEGGSEGRPALFRVDPKMVGAPLRTVRLADASLVSDIAFDGVELDATARLGGPDGAALLDDVLDAVRVGAAAELVGLATAAMEMTFEYLRDRKQFGVEIGSFQALQHRAAILYAEVEMARAAVLKAQHALDEEDKDQSAHASVAKAAASLAATLAVQEGVQMHGGIGMTDEHDIGLYMKRARVLAERYGDANHHADRLAVANGY